MRLVSENDAQKSLRFPPLPKQIDNRQALVQTGAKRCTVAKTQQQKRFTVSLDNNDYEALRAIAESHRPPLKLQYVVNVAVKNLLERHAARQLTFPLDD